MAWTRSCELIASPDPPDGPIFVRWSSPQSGSILEPMFPCMGIPCSIAINTFNHSLSLSPPTAPLLELLGDKVDRAGGLCVV